MEKSQVRPTFLDKIINIWSKIWTDIYNKPTDSKRYVLFTQKHRLHDLTNLLFSFAKGICTIVENKVLKKNGSRTEKKTLLQQTEAATRGVL